MAGSPPRPSESNAHSKRKIKTKRNETSQASNKAKAATRRERDERQTPRAPPPLCKLPLPTTPPPAARRATAPTLLGARALRGRGGRPGPGRPRRRPPHLERLAALQGGGEPLRRAARRRDLPGPLARVARLAAAPLPAAPLQAPLLGPPQPLRPRRLRCQDLDLPALLLPQPLPAPLRRHLRVQRPRRALPAVLHRRVPPRRRRPGLRRAPPPGRSARAAAPGIPLRDRHLRHRGGARVRQDVHAEGRRAPAGARARRPRHVRDAGASARARVLRSQQDLRLPGHQGDLQGADFGSAWVGGCGASGFPQDASAARGASDQRDASPGNGRGD